MKTLSSFMSIVLLAFMTVNTFAQHMNKYGHFIPANVDPNFYEVSISTEGSEVKADNLVLKGNTAYRTQQGFVTLSGNYENAPSTLRVYSKEGEEIFAQSFSQTINFAMNPAKNFCAFHDMKKIYLVNLLNHEVTNFQGSNVFAINDAGEIAFYDDVASDIIFKSTNAKISDPVYRILFFNNEPLFISMTSILRLRNNLAESIFTSTTGRIFDVGIFNDELYISVKKEIPGEFVFNSFSTNDLRIFNASEEVHFPLESHLRKKIKQAPAQDKKEFTLSNETILDPLDYYNDTVYRQVGNSYCEIQEYSPTYLYLHPGVDLMDTFMREVYSVKKGYVKAILTTSGQYHWRIAISNLNTTSHTQGYLYAHLEQTSFPYAVGDSVNAGDIIGYLADFPVTGFVHCHFARIADQGNTWNGGWSTFDNPLCYMSNFFDSIPPEFEKTINNDVFAFRDAFGNYLAPDSLYGEIKVISKVFDRINSNWHCDVNKLRYSVSPLTSPQTNLLDSVAYEYNFYNDFYFSGPYSLGVLQTIYSRDATCFSTGNYIDRDFYHIITNSDGNDTITGADSLQLFNTLSLPNGSYIIRVTASDPSENTTTDSMIIEIKNVFLKLSDLSLNSQIKVFPNPFSYSTTLWTDKVFKDMKLTLYNSLGQIVKNIYNISDHKITFYRNNLPKGLYFLQLTENNKIIVNEKLVIMED